MGEYGVGGGGKGIAPKHVIVSQFAIGGNSLYCYPTPVVYTVQGVLYRVYFGQDFFNIINCKANGTGWYYQKRKRTLLTCKVYTF